MTNARGRCGGCGTLNLALMVAGAPGDTDACEEFTGAITAKTITAS